MNCKKIQLYRSKRIKVGWLGPINEGCKEKLNAESSIFRSTKGLLKIPPCYHEGYHEGYFLFQDPPEDALLHVQHRLPLHDDVHPHGGVCSHTVMMMMMMIVLMMIMMMMIIIIIMMMSTLTVRSVAMMIRVIIMMMMMLMTMMMMTMMMIMSALKAWLKCTLQNYVSLFVTGKSNWKIIF